MGSGRGKRLNKRVFKNQMESGVLRDPDTLKQLSRLTPPASYTIESDEPTREKWKKVTKVADDGEPIRLALVRS